MTNHYPVVIVGGGQAGLSMSYCLKERDLDHIVFEKNQIANAWRSQRWDSFCLVTPNWQCQLPGYPYKGNEPEGFIKKDEIVAYIENYARSFNPPIKEGVEVLNLRRGDRGIFEVTTSIGDYTADQVVVAAGAYHQPKIPKISERLPDHILQVHSSKYKNPESLPEGAVLVIGTGQSGCQIAEDLHLAGRKVHLCVGSAPRSPRRYRGKDAVEWLDLMGYYDLSIDQHPQKEKVRSKANHYLTGRDGGREIDLRRFALEGMQLHGRLKNIASNKLEFFNDLKQNLDGADAVSESIKKTIDNFIAKNNLDAPLETPYQPVWQPAMDIPDLDLAEANITTVIWCTGFQSDFSWIEIPVFDGKGYPCHDRGVTDIKGLYFLGLPWLYTWGSGRFSGVARDATYLADYIMARRKVSHASDWTVVNEFLLGS
ncbi:MAG: MSMEG_0569 family flavin-dependent oxidoreductase [Pseudanabaena sp.]|jgi:putative flavoprotein involved in K+ transport|nr:MSMEG_0569 family flavin-dependent oxidoreductase [Pseudanabaena sp. M090S1SP2A07QC]MCA6505481.1 MSMEG_0569 family flavin-dependent oxidoreductase [Pseudanabaena sp. M172S2SP2A07QC]MCA6509935.1 MSMEG_0569 family flavin-dependent oxidoreductase [Pseudanabaena sp. M109S1SP2A07QC]MCA6523158.1 MSMEG_0569 family flavin-dependent oxidoreductase [Pseudanabaena sp. M051S1SP2A07QC]MCA6526008.1 MSMEG_0569 family flavin-dependent oxidoreductase [Pseudanabaena sp. M179S2SP2A07QC]MCA6529040.1 MSMEG_0569